ncbi:uncharacterized protein [Phyllobates terribilis]|uniref:uncharacterized protein n=1 Tax=Phyllobates terribilis TaxID=111132 RepID=UPI003CCB712C
MESHENGERNSKGATRSWGTTISGQSVSTSGSVGSPSSRSEAGAMTAGDNTVNRLSHLEIHGEDSASQGPVVGTKKKRVQRATGGDKSGRGLRQFSMKVCEKVESKGTTTYNEVADELVAEFADPSNSPTSPDQLQYEEKNIRRRVYDALNVLMAMDIISKDKKEIHWKGLPRTSISDIEELKAERLRLRSRIEKRATYLQELEEQLVGYQQLVQRNQQLCSSGNAPTGGVALPFILVQTRPNATVEVEISEDMQLVHFDFNSTPFELHDDNYVLKQLWSKEGQHGADVAQNGHPSGTGGADQSRPLLSVVYEDTLLTRKSSMQIFLPNLFAFLLVDTCHKSNLIEVF